MGFGLFNLWKWEICSFIKVLYRSTCALKQLHTADIIVADFVSLSTEVIRARCDNCSPNKSQLFLLEQFCKHRQQFTWHMYRLDHLGLFLSLH